ncbi:hypothetical protein [Streptomyces sennicomposti]|uniref:hypothetical protein n=1 Tax=Streptomyces sennicomposti TaxID=2873384 RepID=UPI001CA73F9C|nr:hypothetical protein [Streptomyces sennicomposti]MBY8869655.1 hypothetical protein [Streptomyces sennicomposti]
MNDLPGAVGRLLERERELDLLTAPVPDSAVTVMTVDGTAGVGKTTLVVHPAHRLRAVYPDGCLYVDLRPQPRTVRPPVPAARAAAAAALPRRHRRRDPGRPRRTHCGRRAATSSLRLLMVLDDTAGSRQAEPLLPAGPGSLVLIAGRRLVELDADRRLTLEPPETGSAVSVLRHLIGERRADGEPEATRELARLCDGLPLARCIAGARLQTRPAWSPAYLVERLSGDEGRLGALWAGDRSVEAAFRLSYEQLPERLRRGFRVLGMVPTAEVDRLTSAAMLGCPPRDAEEILENRVDTSLLQQPV